MPPESEEAMRAAVSRALDAIRDTFKELEEIDGVEAPALVSAAATALGELIGRDFSPGPNARGLLIKVGLIVEGAVQIAWKARAPH